MELRNLSKNSQKSYLNAVSGISRYYMQPPDQLTKEMIEDYLLYLKKEKQFALTTVGAAITGIRFFYNHVIQSASILKNNRVVFSIAGNKYRLIVRINHSSKTVFVRFIGTYKAYDKIDAEAV